MIRTRRCQDEKQAIELIGSEVVYDGFRKVSIHGYREDGRGKDRVVKREIMAARDAVAVVAYDPALKKLVLIHQFRVAAHLATGSGMTVEIVAGLIEEGDTPDITVVKELQEEAGLTPSRITRLCSYLTSPGMTDEVITLFYAEVDAANLTARAGLDSETEETFPFTCTLEEALQAIDENAISNGIAMFALLWFARHKDSLVS